MQRINPVVSSPLTSVRYAINVLCCHHAKTAVGYLSSAIWKAKNTREVFVFVFNGVELPKVCRIFGVTSDDKIMKTRKLYFVRNAADEKSDFCV